MEHSLRVTLAFFGWSRLVDTIHIEADAVTAAKIDVTDMAAINADLGAITAGTLQADTATKIRCQRLTLRYKQAL